MVTHMNMNITGIKIRKLFTEGRLKANVSITLGDFLAVHDIKVIQGPTRLFVAMPSRRDESGVFRDIVHPISASGRQELESRILQEYEVFRDAQQELPPAEPAVSFRFEQPVI